MARPGAVRFLSTLALALIFALLGSGCQTFESAAITDVTLRNDTQTAVVVRACSSSTCKSFRYTQQVMAGKSVPATDQGDGKSWWVVSAPDGKRLGCLSLDYTHRVEGYVLRISRASSCPT
jgi:hypothetical protein